MIIDIFPTEKRLTCISCNSEPIDSYLWRTQALFKDLCADCGQTCCHKCVKAIRPSDSKLLTRLRDIIGGWEKMTFLCPDCFNLREK
jgi:hypothetical protein